MISFKSFVVLPILFAACVALAKPLERGDPKQLGFDPAKLTTISKEIDGLINDNDLPGAIVAIVRRDKLAYFKTFGKLKPSSNAAMPPNAVFQIFSMTKPIIAVAVMQLVESGKLSLDDPVEKYIPAFGETSVWENGTEVPPKRAITIAELLRHTSGLTYGFFGTGHVRAQYKAKGVDARIQTLSQFVDNIASIPLEHHPGTVWEYSMASDVLGRVIEIVSDKPLQDYLKQNIFDPLGMNDTGFTGPLVPMERVAGAATAGWQLRPADVEVPFKSGGGGLLSTMDDYLSFCRMILHGGSLNGNEVLSKATIALMTRDQLGGLPRGQSNGPGYGYGFGFGFAVRTDDQATYPGSVGDLWWGGYAGSYFWIDPTEELIAVILVQAPNMRRTLRPLMRGLVYDALLR
jgi:CubicO group peptidase (beta-lactamase class C family)